MVGLMQPQLSFIVNALFEAMKFWNTDELALIDILCTASPYDIESIVKKYKESTFQLFVIYFFTLFDTFFIINIFKL